MRFAQCTLFSLLFASTAAYSDWVLNLTPGVTPISHDIYHLHMTIFWICVGIGILVFGVMLYAIIHHRQSQHATPAKFHEHLWVELTWTIIPVIILIIIAFPAGRVLSHMRNTEASDITVKITAYQWKWQYEYLEPNGIKFFSNSTTPLEQIQNKIPKSADYLLTVDHPLVLPIHKKIRFLITANDVIHAWWVPAFGIKQDAIPGYINELWTRIDRPGTYHGQCAELCGINHAYMPIVVIAMADEDFQKWVIQQKTGIVPTPRTPATVAPLTTTKPEIKTNAPIPDQMSQGEKIYAATCAVCHQANGEGMPPTYPALKNGPITTGPLPQHMNRVLFGKMGTAMQAFKDQLSDEELAAVITYERNSWGNKGGMVQPADIATAKQKGPLPE